VESAVKVCDLCQSHPAYEFRIWRDGDMHAKALDLCRACSKPLTEGGEVELPIKPRQRMELTQLRTTKQTAEFKKKKRTPPKR
jgi:hypothetical protein